MTKETFEYDVCFSFAGEDREYVEEVATHLVAKGIGVFYDKYEQASLWGKDLYAHLDDVYRNKARFCVVFISEHYGKKLWTSHERKSAQARAFEENYEYILPARFDDTEIPGILPTMGHVSLQDLTPAAFADLIESKLTYPQAGQAMFRTDYFQRIYFEAFNYGSMPITDIKKSIGQIWLIGNKGHWSGNIAKGEYQLENHSGPDASLHNTIRYFQPDDNPIDLGNSRVSVRVRIEPPSDKHSGAGILFRCSENDSFYYSFFLHPGNSVSIAQTTSGKLSFLRSFEVKPGTDGFALLKVEGLNETIYFYVNDHLVYTMRDAQQLYGNPGVVVLSIGRFAFKDFSIFMRVSE